MSALALAEPIERSAPSVIAGPPGLTLREAVPVDIEEGGRVLYESFATLGARHGFPPDFPTVDVATGCMRNLVTNPGFHGVVAERAGALVGSAFLDERSTIRAIGPVSVDPGAQNGRVGRALTEALLARAAATRAPGVRLVQISYHNRSLSLYAKLGFDVRETFAALSGTLSSGVLPGYAVRPAAPRDVAASNALCVRVHGHDRAGEVGPAFAKGRARVVERLGRITGYATGIGYFDHAVAETTDDLVALISSTEKIGPPGIVVPLSNPELFRWCLGQGLRVFFVLNLMAIGMYQQPRGAWLASIGY